MPDTIKNSFAEFKKPFLKAKFFQTPLFHLLLAIGTFLTTFVAGMEWTSGSPGPYGVEDFGGGLQYASAIIFILAVHEFGHYFAARYHKVDATLPYFIPFPPIPIFLNFGTLGAVIKTRSQILNNKAMFDIGVSGPIAGFFACLIVLIYGFSTLPGTEYILAIHPDYFDPDYGRNAMALQFGDTLLYSFLKGIFVSPDQFIPPMSEIYHYPFLCVGWFGLFVTAMNMIPVGQLDGGHIIYSMFGTKVHNNVSALSLLTITVVGVFGVVNAVLETNIGFGWSGWLFWALILYFVIKMQHPPVPYFEPLGKGRMILGWISIIILMLSFSPTPFVLTI